MSAQPHTIEHFMGRVIALDAEVEEIKRRQAQIDNLVRSVDILSHQVRKLGQAVGITQHVPLPADWEEITQVGRPELHSLRVRARRGPAVAGAGVGLAWALVELLRAVAEGRLHWPW